MKDMEAKALQGLGSSSGMNSSNSVGSNGYTKKAVVHGNGNGTTTNATSNNNHIKS